MAAQEPQHFSDHLEIQSVLNLYASAIDKRHWSQLEQVFTPDAVANFIGIGQFEGRQAITDLISSVLCQCAATQHLLGNYEIQVNGDEAHTTCYLSAMHAGHGRLCGGSAYRLGRIYRQASAHSRGMAYYSSGTELDFCPG